MHATAVDCAGTEERCDSQPAGSAHAGHSEQGRQATFLQGVAQVSRSDVIRELRSGKYDVLMAMTHGYAQGIQLAPGAWLEPQHLASLARFGVSLVVLLACDSNVAGQAVISNAQVNAVC